MTKHPSYLALEAAALGAPLEAPFQTHLSTCPDCDSYVERQRRQLPVPAWVTEHGKRFSRWSSWLPAFGATAAAVGLMAWVFIPKPIVEEPKGEAVAAKGMPAVSVYVRSGDQVSLWDGRSALNPGDSLRLRVAGAGFSHLAVATAADRGSKVWLFDDAVAPAGDTLLPVSWRVDPGTGGESLELVFSHARLSPDAREVALSREERSQRAWTTHLSFTKKQTTPETNR